MNKIKLLWNKLSVINVLSLGLMVLGIGCVSWAMVGMWTQPDYTVDINTLTSTETLEVDHSIVMTSPDKVLYPVNPAEGDTIGSLMIPVLNLEIPILQGTSVKVLKDGVGHFIQSVLPGEEDNCVLSGHNDTVFKKIDTLKVGDQLIVQTSAGKFTYEVNDMKIVREDDRTVIVPTDKAVLTITTCYPFYTIGYASQRYIVSAGLIN